MSLRYYMTISEVYRLKSLDNVRLDAHRVVGKPQVRLRKPE